MKIPSSTNGFDNFQTPPLALEPLLPFIKRKWIIWECAAGKRYLSSFLESQGHQVIASDVLTGENFLTYEPDKYDCIITNPPFSIKQKFLHRCYQLGKPFALLLPLTTLETRKRQALFKKHGIEIILFDKRINFETPSGKSSSSWFATAWFTSGLEIGQQLTFVSLKACEDKYSQQLKLL